MDIAIRNAANVLNDYFCIELPESIIKEVLTEDPELYQECITDGISDTCQREILIARILPKIGIDMQWPTYGDTKEYADIFYHNLEQQVVNYGGKIID